jgi:branched-chain amino acid aminotransferase
MGIPIAILTPQGIKSAPYEASTLAEAAEKEPQGVYTVTRTYHRDQVLLFDQHLDRLERSASLEHISCKLDRPAIRKALRSLIDQAGYTETRFRITIPAAALDQAVISIEPFKPVPIEVIEQGVRVITANLARRNPAAKTTDWIAARKATADGLPVGIYEAILVSPQGTLLEGLSTNFYGIKNDTLRTAGNSEVLSGIARNIVLTVAPEILPVEMQPIHVDEITTLPEAFLTSSGRGIIPIVEIDGKTIADGHPGSYTLRLREAYDQWSEVHLEAI